jgi:hypothetical protein
MRLVLGLAPALAFAVAVRLLPSLFGKLTITWKGTHESSLLRKSTIARRAVARPAD